MDIETLRDYCLSLPLVTEDFPFDQTTLVFRVLGNIFAVIDLNRNDLVTLKCAPDYALILREEHPEVMPAWHWNKKYWNQLLLTGQLDNTLILSLVRHSYAEVAKKLKKSERLAYPDIMTIKP